MGEITLHANRSRNFAVDIGALQHHHMVGVQIEINRALYMNETSYEKSPNFESLKTDLTGLIAALSSSWQDIRAVPEPNETKAAE